MSWPGTGSNYPTGGERRAMETGHIQVGDICMHYRFLGEGPPLVMAMGYTASMDCWEPKFLDKLTEHRRVLVFDNRGAGRTPAGTRRFTIKRFADDMAMLMAELGVAKADILGASMGGMIVQEFALNYPGKTDRLVLMCTTCGGPRSKPPMPRTMAPLIKRYPTPEEQMRASMFTLYPQEWIDANPQGVEDTIAAFSACPITPANARRQMLAILMHNTYRRLPLIESETLVMCGECDILIPQKNSRILADRIPRSELKVFEGGGHGFAMQFPEKVTGTLVDFLQADQEAK
jgi:pimeloyl-ACP methyl ester carboxylesterase